MENNSITRLIHQTVERTEATWKRQNEKILALDMKIQDQEKRLKRLHLEFQCHSNMPMILSILMVLTLLSLLLLVSSTSSSTSTSTP